MYQQDLQPALEAFNLVEADLKTILKDAKPRIEDFRQKVVNGDFPAFGSALQLSEETADAVNGWKDKFEHVLILGLGGSSLGGRLIDTFADPAHLTGPRLHFLDHLCPMLLGQLLKQLPLEKTALIAISKSGSTLETTTQLNIFTEAFAKAGVTLKGRCIIVTEPNANPLREWAFKQPSKNKVVTLPHNPALGGRYSFFAETGTLPAMLKGISPAKLHNGAQHTLREWFVNPLSSPSAMGAALQAASAARGKSITVMYAYGEPYRILPAWFEQLWAESLGKNGKGTTPLGASGPSSQHSIQQLFLAGPADKFFTVILPETHKTGPSDNTSITTGTLQLAMGQGTITALANRKHPTRIITMPAHDAESLGALLMHFMLETVLTACIWNINPFDQPAVEESKKTSLAALDHLKRSA